MKEACEDAHTITCRLRLGFSYVFILHIYKNHVRFCILTKIVFLYEEFLTGSCMYDQHIMMAGLHWRYAEYEVLKLKLNLFNIDTRRTWLPNLPSQGLVLKVFDD